MTTTTETPASQLREAAALLRERVGAASPGRWSHMCLGSEGCQVLNDGHLRERKHVARFGRKEWKADHADAQYVALMDPVVGAALADWLEAAAKVAWRTEGEGAAVHQDSYALKVARAILGKEQSDEAE